MGMRRLLHALPVILFLSIALADGPAVSAGRTPVRSLHFLRGSEYGSSLEEDIKEAKESIDVMMFLIGYHPGQSEYSWPKVLVNELIRAHRRGVKVRVKVEGSIRGNAEGLKHLKAAGIDASVDEKGKVTHTKLVVIDRKIVYVGSQNWTVSAMGFNWDSSIRVESEELAEDLIRRAIAPHSRRDVQ